MRKMIALFLVFLMLSASASAMVTVEQLDELSKAEKSILKINIETALANKKSGKSGEKYSSILKMDLMELSIEELNWMHDYLIGETGISFDGHIQNLPEKYGIKIVESDEVFSSENRLQFCLFSTVSDVCRTIGTIVQNNNPEITLEADSKTLDFARFYITCYAQGSREDLVVAVEEYTDVLIETICASYPNLNINTLNFCWKIPTIDPDSLYSAMYWCEKNGNVIKRSDGTGILYKEVPHIAHTESTNMRSLVDFLELYAFRLKNYANENDLSFDISSYADLSPYKVNDYLVFESSAGSIGVYPGSYAIHDLTMTFNSMTADSADNELFVTNCIMALSALEFDASYEQGLSYKSAIEDAAQIFIDAVENGLEEKIIQAINTGERIFVCSYNYDYYVDYFASEGHEFLYLIAEERQ